MLPCHPSFIREEILEELGLSVARAAEVLGVRRATLSDLVNGKAGLPAEMALRVEKAFGVSMDTLLRMQAWYDSYTMRQREAEIDVRRFTPDANARTEDVRSLAGLRVSPYVGSDSIRRMQDVRSGSVAAARAAEGSAV
jgi:antitoxin HigA-1